MSAPDTLDDAVGRLPVIGIIRGCPVAHVARIAAAAVDAGMQAIEVTLDSPSPLEAIRRASEVPGAIVGVGTVLRAEEVEDAAAAGARFLVSPVVSDAVISAAVGLGIPALPGAATPTEIAEALDLGAHAVKVFPARELGGASFLSAIRAPLRNPRLVPTGGVDAATAAGYLDAGAWAVGVGGSVFSGEAMASGDAARIREAAAALIGALR